MAAHVTFEQRADVQWIMSITDSTVVNSQNFGATSDVPRLLVGPHVETLLFSGIAATRYNRNKVSLPIGPLQRNELTTLVLSELGAASKPIMQLLCSFVSSSKSLTTLDASGCTLSAAGGIVLADALKLNRSVTLVSSGDVTSLCKSCSPHACGSLLCRQSRSM